MPGEGKGVGGAGARFPLHDPFYQALELFENS